MFLAPCFFITFSLDYSIVKMNRQHDQSPLVNSAFLKVIQTTAVVGIHGYPRVLRLKLEAFFLLD